MRKNPNKKQAMNNKLYLFLLPAGKQTYAVFFSPLSLTALKHIRGKSSYCGTERFISIYCFILIIEEILSKNIFAVEVDLKMKIL